MSIEVHGQSEMGYLLQALTQHLLTVIPKNCHDDVESWMDGAELQLNPINRGKGLQLGLMEYESVISIENLPFRKFNPAIIMASVMAWLQDNDCFRADKELEDPTFEVEPVSDALANVELQIQFIEPITVIEKEDGEILWRNKRYQIAPYEVWFAENLVVTAKGTRHDQG